MDSNKKIIDSLWKLYNEDLKEEIKSYWMNIVGPEDEEDFYEWQSKQIPWFGNLEAWIDEIFVSEEVPAVFKKFPRSIREHPKETAAEMNFLFPQERLTAAFLPIILTSYCVKRKQPSKNPRKSRGEDSSKEERSKEERSKEEPSKQLIDMLFGRKPNAPKENVRYSQIESYLNLSALHKKNKKMKWNQANYKNPGRTLEMYSTPILFLFFLTKVSDKCNVSWSFYVFERMTKALHLLGSDAKALIYKLSELSEDSLDSDVMKCDPLKNDILELAESILNDALKAPKDGTSERFLIFLTTVRAEFAKREHLTTKYSYDDTVYYWIPRIDDGLLDVISPEDDRRNQQMLIAQYMKLRRKRKKYWACIRFMWERIQPMSPNASGLEDLVVHPARDQALSRAGFEPGRIFSLDGRSIRILRLARCKSRSGLKSNSLPDTPLAQVEKLQKLMKKYQVLTKKMKKIEQEIK